MRTLRAVVAGFLVGACATPYQSSGFSGGYSDNPLGNDSYAISIEGNSFTSSGTALSYAYRRAGELCPAGFDVITGAQSQRDLYLVTNSSISNHPKPSVTLAVHCRSRPVPPLPIQSLGPSGPPGLTDTSDVHWWCTSLDGTPVTNCYRAQLECEQQRATMSNKGITLNPCVARAFAACFHMKVRLGGGIAESCHMDFGTCREQRDWVMNNHAADIDAGECRQTE